MLVYIPHVSKRLVLLQRVQTYGMTVPLNKDKELTNFDKVKEFMNAFGQEVVAKPEWPSAETMELRIDLIEEEVKELSMVLVMLLVLILTNASLKFIVLT